MFNTLSIKKPNSNSKTGFTIIELLVVIAIIGLISSVVLVSMKGSTGKAKIAKGLEFSQTTLNTIGHDAVGVWTFDEGSGGTANDKSGYRNHGTIHGATFVSGEENTPHWFVDRGEGKSALKFDGNDYVSIPSINPIEAITVEAWVKSATSTGYSGVWQIVSKYPVYILGTSGTGSKNMCFIIANAAGWQYNSCYTVSKPQNWHHFVGTYDSSAQEKKIYVDGKLRDTTNTSGTIRADTGPLNIGKRECCPNYFNGFIDEVRIYERALGSSEIQQHYAEGAEKHQLAINNQ